MGQFSFSLKDVKKELGTGLSVRSNIYLLLVSVPGALSKKLAILCQSTSLPERTIGSVELFIKGRRFRVRGETDLQATYTVNFIDDSEMKVRELFMNWMREVDNTTLNKENALGIFGDFANDLVNGVSGIVKSINNIKTLFSFDKGLNFFQNALTNNEGSPYYMRDVEIWQLSKTREKVKGYRLTNCFVTSVGAVETSDEEVDALSRFSVDFTYSDVEFIKNESYISEIFNTIIGNSGQDLVNGIKNIQESLLD